MNSFIEEKIRQNKVDPICYRYENHHWVCDPRATVLDKNGDQLFINKLPFTLNYKIYNFKKVFFVLFFFV